MAADLPTLAAGIEARPAAVAAAPDAGRLGELAGWLAATTDVRAGGAPRRARCVCVGHVPGATLRLSDELGVGIREVVPESDDSDDGSAIERGVAAADAEIDAGADLLVVATGEVAPDVRDAAAALVAALRDLEPVAVLPRGAAATDTRAWIARAERVRTLRRRLIGSRSRPAEVLDRLGDPTLAALGGVVVRATSRRTPLLLAGVATYAAALVVERLHRGARDWWQLADSTPEPVLEQIARELELTPLLRLDVEAPGGAAGLLAVQLVRAAAVVAP
jgi:NaMN:DMB phosphoribosyltransferase